jgi:DNA-binding NarL/FixJ family response regulator
MVRPVRLPRVAIFANTPALRAGLTSMLTDDPRTVVLTDDDLGSDGLPDVILIEASAVASLEDLIDEQWPETALLIIGEPDAELMAGGERIVGAISAASNIERLTAAIRALAAGLVVLDPVLDARFGISLGESARRGGEPNLLTPRERQVLELVARGYPNKSIAYELGISEHTAKFHVGSLLVKLEAASRTEVVTNATRRGILTV